MKVDAEGRVVINAPVEADEAADTVPPAAPTEPTSEPASAGGDVLPGEEGESTDLTIGAPYILRGQILLPIGSRTLALTLDEAEQLAADLIDVIAQL